MFVCGRFGSAGVPVSVVLTRVDCGCVCVCLVGVVVVCSFGFLLVFCFGFGVCWIPVILLFVCLL